MQTNTLMRRGRSLENGFFITQESIIISNLKEEHKEKVNLEKLKQHTGISNDQVLKDAMDFGLTPSTLYAFIYFPIVYTAWSDDLLDDKEKKKIKLIAKDLGICAHEDSVKQIEYWLNNRPGPQVFEAWKKFFKEYQKNLRPEQLSKLKAMMMEKAQTVASASGILPFIGNISRAEQKFLDSLEAFLNVADEGELESIKVADFMTENVFCCNENQTVENADTVMLAENFSVIPVVNNEDELVGVITESDFVGKQAKVPHALASIKSMFGQHFYFSEIEPIYKNAKGKKLKEVMTKNPITVTEEHTLTDIIELMNQRSLKRLPVVRGKRVVGIVTRKDLLKAFLILD